MGENQDRGKHLNISQILLVAYPYEIEKNDDKSHDAGRTSSGKHPNIIKYTEIKYEYPTNDPNNGLTMTHK